MIVFLLVIAASSIGVNSQLCLPPVYQPYNLAITTRRPYESPQIPCEGFYLPQTVMPNEATTMPVAVLPETTICLQQTVVPVTNLETTVPVIPFITDLPNCPDICFNDILTSPLGCLDPILITYGAKEVCPLPEMPVSPLLPAASPVSARAPPFSRLLPPVSDCECFNNYHKRVPIPPPFI